MNDKGWLEQTYEKLDRVLKDYDVSTSDLAAMSGLGVSWTVKFVARAHKHPTITRVQRLHDTLEAILAGRHDG